MHILSKSTLKKFWERHREIEPTLRAWHKEVTKAQWTAPEEILQRYANASIVGSNRVVFRFKGAKYRMIVKVDYRMRRVYVRFIGTHAEYNTVNAEEV